MADDITLNVRVRDMTRGEFNNIRQRMRGMGGDIRQISRASDGATDSSDRFANSLTGLQRRLSQFQRTGNLARHEMDFMRRSMGLLGRDLRNAAADGELTEDQFRDLRRELERTRLDFDHLDNQLRRQDAMAQRRARNAADRQREAERLRREAARSAAEAQREVERRAREERRRQEADARVIVALRRRMSQAHAAALREEAQRNAAAVRDELRQQQSRARQLVAQQQRISRAHSAALREEAQRNRRAEVERNRAAAAAAAAQRQAVGRLAGLGEGERGIALRFRALGTRDMDRMTRGFANLQQAMSGISGSSARAQRSVRTLNGDLRTMAQALRQAQDAGTLSRREFNALSNGLRMTTRDARQLRREGDLTRSTFRDMRRDVTGLQAQLRLLGREGNAFARLSDRTLLLQRRLRETREHAGAVRRTMSRLGEGALGPMRMLSRGLGVVQSGLGRMRQAISGASHGMKMFLLILGLLAPLAPVVGALLTTVLGGAFVALGAFALRGEKDVKAAFKSMKSTIGTTVRAAAQPLKAALVVAMNEVTVATQNMGNALYAAFNAAAPLVKNLAGAFTDLVGKAMPGFVTSLQDMGPVIEGFREAMGMIGEGLGGMFAAMTGGGGAEGLADTWKILGDGIRDVLIDIGEFINQMSQSATATTLLKTAFEALSAILSILEGAFTAFDFVLGPIIETLGQLGLTLGPLGYIATVMEAIGLSSGTVKTGMRDISGAQEEAATATLSHASALKQLNEEIRTSNQLNLARFDAEAGLNQAFRDAKKNVEEYGNTVKINNGIFDTTHANTAKVYEDFSKLAENTNRAVEAAENAHQPFKEQNRLWKQGEADIRALGKAYGIPKAELDAFIKLVLKTPESAKTKMELEAEEAREKAKDLLKKYDKADGFLAKSKAALEAGAALAKAERLDRMLRALDGQTANTYIKNHILTIRETRAIYNTSGRPEAGEGGVSKFAAGGPIMGGSGVRDDIPILAMGGEFMVNKNAARKHRRLLEAINEDRLPGFAKGGSVKSEAKQAVKPIKAATSGDTEKNLLRLMNSIVKGTIKMATALKQVNSALEKAKNKLTSLKSAASALSSAVKTATMSDITAGVETGKPVTVSALMSRMTAGRDKAVAFASALKQLQKKGLSKGLIKQIAEAGVEGGGLETAGALLSASGSELKSFNALYGQTAKAAASAGKTAADAMFKAQIKSQEKLVKALDELSKALKKATSKKKKATGGIIGAASGGLRGGLVEVGEQGPELVRLPFGSSVYSNADSRRMAGRGAGMKPGAPTVIQVFIGEKKIDEVVLDSNRRTVRTRGGNVQAIFSQR